MSPKPYIGVTGFKTADEVRAISTAFYGNNINGGSHYTGMLGFLCDHKNLADPDSVGKQSPALRALPELMRLTPPRLKPMLHYWTPHHDTLADEVTRALEPLYEPRICRAV